MSESEKKSVAPEKSTVQSDSAYRVKAIDAGHPVTLLQTTSGDLRVQLGEGDVPSFNIIDTFQFLVPNHSPLSVTDFDIVRDTAPDTLTFFMSIVAS